MTTFQLRQEMKQLAQVEKEFKVESIPSAVITDRISEGGNVIAPVRLSVCFHFIFGTD